MAQSAKPKNFWDKFYGPNMGYVEEQYELYKEDMNAVDSSMKKLFEQYGAPKWTEETGASVASFESATEPSIDSFSKNDVKTINAAMRYLYAIRTYGHLDADVYAVGKKAKETNVLEAKNYNLTVDDLRQIPAGWVWDYEVDGVETAYDVIQYLKEIYTGKVSFQYTHVNNDVERHWLRDKIETGDFKLNLSAEEKIKLLERLHEVEGFEQFLQKTFVGQKRFSVEGLETMIPVIDQIVRDANQDNVENIMMGMAHRGRLSVLAHILGKPLDKIFSEFQHSPDKELMPSEGSSHINYGWTGDVKYHFGAIKKMNGGKFSTRIRLASNPSHLEFVNPVVQGYTRAAQDFRNQAGYPEQDFKKALSVLIHGDASFIGEGIVPETLNLSGLDGYRVGGTLHIIANNLIGFTTDSVDSRTTRYTSDLAKGFEIPIFRANADDPLSAIGAIKLAYEYMQTFHKDCLLDLVGYRRYGHNEMDEPRSTQPALYAEIDQHPTVTEIFGEHLEKEGIIEANDAKAMSEKVQADLQAIYESLEENQVDEDLSEISMPEVLESNIDDYETAVPLNVLEKLNEDLLKRPEGFNQFKRLNRVFKRRKDILKEGGKANWAEGEALAYASILKDGIPIRLTGQDSERGTFAHRHLVLYDTETNERYSPMHGLDGVNTTFDIRNSPLSEAAVLGFEYGYSVESPDTLVIWEAQFGDFANAAQVIFDQFISSARAKWGDKSNLVMLLPHGYEGQGPEHSSARLERFLQMAGENNWIIANVTSAAQFFHLLRRQALMQGRAEARPLVVMSPKSLLRNEHVASEPQAFSEGKFEPLRNQPNLNINHKVKRLLLGSGKVMVDIEEAILKSEENYDWLRAMRVEQLYPFPRKALKEAFEELEDVEEVVWVQEEPKNMGGWLSVVEELREVIGDVVPIKYLGRPTRASTAVGEPNAHKAVQSQIIYEAINPTKGGNNSEGN